MDTANSKIKRDADSYTVRLFDYIPVNPQMIEQVRRLDGFNVSNTFEKAKINMSPMTQMHLAVCKDRNS